MLFSVFALDNVRFSSAQVIWIIHVFYRNTALRLRVQILRCFSLMTVTDLFLRGLRREDFIQFKGHDFALVGEVEDGVVVGVEAQHSFGVDRVLLLLTDGPDAAEHTDVTWETKQVLLFYFDFYNQ